MKLETFWLGRGASTLAAVFAIAFVLTFFGSPEAPGRLAFERYVGLLEGRLRFLRSRLAGRRIVAGQLALMAATVAAADVLDEWLVCLGLPLVLFAPKLFLDYRASKRTTLIENQLEAWLGAVANALKASASLGEAIASSARLVPTPMSEELELMMKEYELGTPLDDAVQRFSDRVPSNSVAGAVLALKVARRSGGNLPEMLENASSALRELARLEGVVRSKTAEGKAQAFVISLIPIPMVGGVHFSDPHFFEPILHSFVGHLVIAAAVALWIFAVLLARKILAVDV